jgi:hypothetical protein
MILIFNFGKPKGLVVEQQGVDLVAGDGKDPIRDGKGYEMLHGLRILAFRYSLAS